MSTSVLIVEDDPLTQRTLEHLLAPHVARGALQVRWADSADGARAAFEDVPATTVVCDLYLPTRDGISLGEELKKRGATRVLLMGAGQPEPRLRERARERLGAEIYGKPLELPDLVASIVGQPLAAPPSSDLPEAGSLAERSAAQRLLELWEERRSGELTLTRGRIKKIVSIHHGAPVGVTSNLRNETLGHFLVQRGRISDAQHQEALATAQREGDRLGRALVRLDFITEAKLLDELAAQVRHKLWTTLRWPEGEHLFTAGTPPTDRLELPFEAPRLVFAGLRKTARLDEIVPRLREEPARIALTLRAERHRQTLVKVFGAEGLALLDRRPLVAEALAHHDAANILVLCDALLCSGCAELELLGEGAQATPARDPLALIELGRGSRPLPPAPRAIGDEGLYIDPDTGPVPRLAGRELEPETVDTGSEDSGVFALPDPKSAANSDEEGAADPQTESLRREVLAEYLTMHQKDHYQLLGVPRNAAAQDIALGNAAVGKRFRFERYAGVDLGRDYARLEEIAARIRLAFEVLSSPTRRAAYDQTLGAPQPAKRDGRLDAEVLSQEGIARLQRGDYHGARQKLALAIDLDPDQPDYHAILGWCTYLTALGPGRESASIDRIRSAALLAQPHLETAITIDPDHIDAHEFLGRIDVARGADATAADHLVRVLDEEPTRAEALTALEAALGRRGEWRRLEDVYRRLIHRLSDDATERPLLVWWRLAELYRTRLADNVAAQVAFERVANLAPDDPRPRRALAELLRGAPGLSDEAARALRETWRLEPEDPAPGRALFSNHRDAERWDAALVTASALACRGAIDETSAAFLKQHRPRFLVRAYGTITAPLVDSLRHPDDELALGAVLAEVFAVAAPDIALSALGVGASDGVQANALPEPFARALTYVSQALAVPAPMVFVRSDFGAEIHIGAARPPVLLIGPQVLATSDLLVLTFRLGRAMSYLWPGRALAGALPPAELKDYLGAALTLAQPGLRFDDPDGRVATLRAKLSGRATSLARVLRPHIESLRSGNKGRIHLGRYVTAMARTADRIGLVVCNDLPTAAAIVQQECALGAEDDLIDFALGDAYLGARTALGLAIAV